MKGTTFYLPSKNIHDRVVELADVIANYYKYNHPETDEEGIVAVTILKGAIFFACDLTRILYCCGLQTELEFVGMRSYAGTVSNNSPRQYLKLSRNLKNRHILLIDDILDTGQTLFRVREELINLYKPKTINICVLLKKLRLKKRDISPDFYGFKIPDIFVVGYGLDYNERYRHMQHIQEFDPAKVVN